MTGRLLAREAIVSCIAAEPYPLRLGSDAMGRPYWVGQPPDSRGALDFNISHTSGMAAVAVCRGGRVGVDVEPARRILGPGAIASLLSPAEAQALTGRRDDPQPERLLALWTLKESYLKARGLGLRLPMRCLEVDLLPGGAELRFLPGIDAASSR